ncbi:MAG: hypothetical protein MJE77_42655 [Proteobacteria bacterium]|nr:hypothetical protein [Pseudomonadota bacterium]
MSDSSWQAIKDVFRHWTGMILPEAIQGQVMEVMQRLAANVGEAPFTYLNRLDIDHAARQEFLDRLGLGTTWFMRDENGLHSLVDTLHRSAPGSRPLYVWSVGCSTGEEPYSLAMAMTEKRLKARILATDLSRSALEKASDGHYEPRALNRLPAAWRKRYFGREASGRVRINDEIRHKVTFLLHNLLLCHAPPTAWSRFDAVVCRNVLIYFDRDQALEIIERLTGYCRPGGYLLLGAIERPLFWMSSVAGRHDTAELVQIPKTPALRPSSWVMSKVRSSPVSKPAATHSSTASTQSRKRQNRPGDRTSDVVAILERAEIAERDGRFDRALELVDRAIAQAPLAPCTHLQRGMILKHFGKVEDAIESLRAARFLDHDTWLAPFQLALCLDAIGEQEDAQEAYRHALGVLEGRGESGFFRPDSEIEELATTAAEGCRARIRPERS